MACLNKTITVSYITTGLPQKESYTDVTKGRNLRDERQFLMLKTSGLVGNQLVLFV